MPVSRQDLLIVATLWLMVFSLSSQLLILAPILPLIGERLSVPDAKLGILMTSYAAAVGVFALFCGPISDRVGRRRILLAGTSALSVMLALHALAKDFGSLLALRALAGAAAGVLGGAGTAYIGDYFPPRRRGWANGWMMSGVAAGQIAGIPLGTLLADRLGFQAPFLIFAATSSVSFLMAWRLLPQPAMEGTGSRLTVGLALAGYGALLRRTRVLVATLAAGLILASFGLFAIYLPAWLEARRSFNSNSIAGLYLLGGAAHVLAGPQAGRLSDLIGRRPLVLGSSVAIILFMLPIPWLPSWAIPGFFFLLFASMASRMSVFQAFLADLVPTAERGSLLSLTLASGQLGLALGSAVAGWCYATCGFQSNTLAAATAVLLTAGLIWRYLPEPNENARAAR